MVDRRNLVIVALATFCLATTLFAVRSAGSTGTYDPWIDTNEDGVINAKEAVQLGAAFGTSGDPTKNVNVTNRLDSYYEFADNVIIPYPNQNWVGIARSTRGYRQVSLFFDLSKFCPNVTVVVVFKVQGQTYNASAEVDRFVVAQSVGEAYRTYPVIGSEIDIEMINYYGPISADFSWGIYMTT